MTDQVHVVLEIDLVQIYSKNEYFDMNHYLAEFELDRIVISCKLENSPA